MTKKDELRKEMLLIRNNIFNKKNKSQLIVEKIINSEYFKNSKVIAFYKPLKNEVDINSLINYALSCGKIVLLPRVVDNEMIFLKIDSETLYEESSFHVFEPIYHEELVYYEKIDLMIIPGVAFSFDNNRLGYGKGYYDRFLKGEDTLKVGVCYKEQFLDCIPTDDNDVKMDLVIYE